MSALEFREGTNTQYTIRGERKHLTVVATRKGIPGFAPEFQEIEICDLVVNFPHGEGKPYAQISAQYECLSIEELREIADKLEQFAKDNQPEVL